MGERGDRSLLLRGLGADWGSWYLGQKLAKTMDSASIVPGEKTECMATDRGR